MAPFLSFLRQLKTALRGLKIPIPIFFALLIAGGHIPGYIES
jgi:hypothetical protein